MPTLDAILDHTPEFNFTLLILSYDYNMIIRIIIII